MQKSKTTTINDVAALAGVSYQTVSRVINQHPSVSQKALEQVQSAIRTLNYQPSNAARHLATSRSATIGVISYGTLHYGPAQTLASLEVAAHKIGYTLSNVNVADLSFSEISNAIQTLRRQRVDGLIIFAPLIDIEHTDLEGICADLPVVFTATEPQPNRAVTSIDQFTGARLGAQHLIQLGHQKIVLLNGPLDWYDALLRQQGWLSALQQADLTPVADFESDWTAAGGYQKTSALLDSKLEFTGLLVANDQMALGALRALHERNINLPEEVSIVGFDDIPESAFLEPPLTTVHQDFVALAKQSLQRLKACMENPNVIEHLTVLVPKLIVRASTAAPHQSKPNSLRKRS
jgi:DNA-binding LacI/PurR family transcriptional regulator